MESPETMHSLGMTAERESRGQPANPGPFGKMAVITVCVCACVCVEIEEAILIF